MGNKHIRETLIEANKKISDMTNQLEKEQEASTPTHRKMWIDDLNTIIRKLDHIVEDLEKIT